MPTEEITPWLTPFEVDAKPVYVMTAEVADAPSLLKQPTSLGDETPTDIPPLAVGQELTEREYTEARAQYKMLERAFKVEKEETERYDVKAVYHPDCRVEVGGELTKAEVEREHRRCPGFNAPPLRHRVMQVYHPDCPLKPGELLTDSEKKQFGIQYPAVAVDKKESEIASDAIKAERMYRVTALNRDDCPFEAGAELSSKEVTVYRRQYKGFDVEPYFEVTKVEDGTTILTVGQRLTEAEYKAFLKSDTPLTVEFTKGYKVLSVHHSDLKKELEVGDELTEDKYKSYNRKFKGFDAIIDKYRILGDERNIEESLEPGVELSAKEYRDLKKESQRPTYTLTEIYHAGVMTTDTPNPSRDYELERARFVPRGQRDVVDAEIASNQHQDSDSASRYPIYSDGDELSTAVSEGIEKGLYPGFEVDEPALRMRIEVETDKGARVPHVIPSDYSFSLAEGDSIRVGETLAELHERTANSDIVAGIPRVTELFEARRPKSDDAAEIAEIEGYVRPAGTKNGVPNYRIEHEGYKSRLYPIPDEKRRVAESDWVNAGDTLTDGFLNPHDILRIGRTTIEGVSVEGEEAVWAYLVDEVQIVYGAGTINDKHIETIVRQMLTKIRITEPGDANFYPNDEVQRKEFERVNNEVEAAGGAPATGEPILQSISKASLSTDSFISAASFQQTTKVLTDAAVSGQTDKLYGLKENVILGRLIPVGSGFSGFRNLEVDTDDTELAEASDDD